MSGNEPGRDLEPEPFFNSTDNGPREDARSPEANPENSPGERRAGEGDEGWGEAGFVIHERNDQQMPAERNPHEDEQESGNVEMDAPGPGDWVVASPAQNGPRRKLSRSQSYYSLQSKWDWRQKCPKNLFGKQIGLWYRDNKPNVVNREYLEVTLSLRTQNSMKELLLKTCGKKCSRLNKSRVRSRKKKKKKIKGKTAKTDNPGAGNYMKSSSFLTRSWKFGKAEENKTRMRAIRRNAGLDAKFYKELKNKRKIEKYREMCKFRETLPAYRMKSEIIQLIKANKVCFISGGTGCGKTTQIVQFVLDDYILNREGSLCNIVCTQPRRVSTSSAAERIAAERFEPLSRSVGYQIRFENKLSKRKVGCINFVTTGVLLQWLITNPELPQISHIFLDEVHEKTIEFDAIMSLIKDMIKKRNDVRVILMSATTDVSSFCKYFGGAPDLKIPGYTFPVEEFYLDDIITMTNYKDDEDGAGMIYDPDYEDYEEDFPGMINMAQRTPFLAPEEIDMSLIAHLIRHICLYEGDGSILVFLPGFAEINRLRRKVEGTSWYSPQKHLLLVAHSMLPSEAQAEIFVTPPDGQRKIILATSIMETSVTLGDMTYVIDSGRIKYCTFNTTLNVSVLETVWISMANAGQRKGRAGRTKPGKCFKLYTKEQEQTFLPYPQSDVQMSTLQYIILQTKLLKMNDLSGLLKKMMDTPDPALVGAALRDLRRMNALNGRNRLTALGYHLSRLPMDVRTAKMALMGALFSCIDPIFSIAACLSYKDPFNVMMDDHSILRVKESYSISETSDHIIYSDILKDWESLNPDERTAFCAEKCLSESTLIRLSDMKEQFAKVLYGMNFLFSPDVKDPASNVNSRNLELVKAIVYAGLYPSIATLSRRSRSNDVETLEGQFASFHGKSYLSEVQGFDMPFFVYHHKLKTGTKVYIHDASMMEMMPILLFSENFEIYKQEHCTFVYINERQYFKMGRRAANYLKSIKVRLDQVVGQALLDKKGFDWTQADESVEFLRGIVDLFTKCQIRITKVSSP